MQTSRWIQSPYNPPSIAPGQALGSLLSSPPTEEPWWALWYESKKKDGQDWYESSWQGRQPPRESPANDVHQQVACQMNIIFWLIGVDYVDSKVSLFELWWTNIDLCWPQLASGLPGFHGVLGWRSLWKEINYNKILGRIMTLTQALNLPHVDGGNRDSGTNADPSDCSSDVQVMEARCSPYQQPTPYLRNQELTLMTISCKYANMQT